MTTSTDPIREGYIPLPEGRVWYRIVGSANAIPLLTLHGGPGAGHDYLEPLEALAADRPVIFYDQLGCGKSDQPQDRSLWRIERFVAEVRAVRQALGLERIHLLGQSWGGWLAIEYMLTQPPGVISLTLASTSASTAEFVREAAQLKAKLPPETSSTLQRYEAAGDLHHPEYTAAVLAFYQKHVCRLDPWPEALLRTVKNLEDNPVYETMNGPNEFTVIGNLKDWDRTHRLEEINVPTLITCGRYDEITPNCAATLQRGIAGSELRIFEQSAHVAHVEEPEAYTRVVTDFLKRVEGKLQT